MKKSLNIIFMGTSYFAVPVLNKIIENGHTVTEVFTQPPKPAGRGYLIHKSPIHELAEQLNIAIRTPKSLKNEHIEKCDVCIVAAYGLILPKEVLELPKYGYINVHGSLLPRWRGAAPIQKAIIAGDNETGITIMKMDEGLDTGDIILQETITINNDDNSNTLLVKLANLGAKMMSEVLMDLEGFLNKSKKQSIEGVTIASKLTKNDGEIIWEKSCHEINNLVRGCFPLAWFSLNGTRVKVLKTSAINEINNKPGIILNKQFIITCGTGALLLEKIQPEGKSVMSGEDFLRGRPHLIGKNLVDAKI